MSRTVTAIYSSRAEAETARARLLAQLDAADVEIFGHANDKELDHFGFSAGDRADYQAVLAGGDFLLCAQVSSREETDRVVEVLTNAMSTSSQMHRAESPSETLDQPISAAPTTEAALLVSKARVLQGGARVDLPNPVAQRSTSERSDFTPPGMIRVARDEILAAGLFKDRTIEASEISEVPVINRHAFVREEVVLRKTVEERTQTITDTVRRTAAEVTNLPPNDRRT